MAQNKQRVIASLSICVFFVVVVAVGPSAFTKFILHNIITYYIII